MFSMKAPSKAEAIVSASCHAVCFLEQVNDALFEFILEWLEVVHSLLVLFGVFSEYFVVNSPVQGTLHP